MRKFLYNITSGRPEKIVPAVVWATLESVIRLMPAVIVFYGIKELFDSFTLNRSLDVTLYFVLAGVSVVWFVLQLAVSSVAYDKEFLAAYDVSAEGRTHLANHLRKLSLGFLDSRDPGDLTTMMLGDYTLVETAVSHLIPQAISAGILLILAFISLGFIDIRMTLSLYAMLPVVLVIIKVTNSFQKKVGQRHVQAKVDSAARLQEYLQGIKDIKAYSMGGEKFVRLDEAFKRLRNESIRIEGLLGPIVMTIISLLRMGLPILVFSGSYMLIGGTLSDATFLMFIVVASRLYDPFTVLMMNYTEMKYSQISAERIMDIRNQPEVKGETLLDDDFNIEFKNVSFAYKEDTVLKNINLTIKPKSLTAFVGPSGSGKSTLVKLIARFYDVQEGTLEIGSTDIREIAPDNLYKHLSMVFQDVYLFRSSIISNIRIGNLDASFEEVVEAAKKAQCHDFIMRLPQGYDTLVGEGGSTLSGGEKQRISIARAFLKQSEIILLDEATAALDLENESEVQKAISNLVKDRTVIVIAHRLKTVMKADTIVVLNHGEVVAEGNHNYLYETCELYHMLVDMQTESRNWKFERVSG